MTKWPAWPGSVTDVLRPGLPTGFIGIHWHIKGPALDRHPRECSIRMVGIVQESTDAVCQLDAAGVMTDSGANACMADLEENLVNCHDIHPVTVGLALASDDTLVMHICRRMGCMPITREDGEVHHQPFLVNTQATDCIMSPYTIIQQTPDCVSWHQEGHLGNSPDSLSFFNNRGSRVLHLQLRKPSGLYYYNTVWGTASTVGCVYSKFTKDWVSTMDGGGTDKDVVNAWATVTTVHRVFAKEKARGKRVAPYTTVGLLVIPEEALFEPILAPLSEQPLDLVSHVIPPSQQSAGTDDNVTTLALDRNKQAHCPVGAVEHTESNMDKDGVQDVELEHNTTPAEQPPWRPRSVIRRPVTTAEHLESELWAARLGFYGWW